MIVAGRARAEAREQERDEAVDVCVIGDVGGGQEMLRLYAAETRPVLAQQRALAGGLFSLPGIERHAM